jgi:hypothetical protein
MGNNKNEASVTLTDAQVDAIAEKAADKAVAKITANFYQEVGKGVVTKIMWLIGVVAVGIYFYLQGKGLIK